MMRPIQTSKAFGSAVRRVRKDRGLSQAELAARAGVGRPWLSELETGKRTAELGRALSVLSALDLAVTFVPQSGADGPTLDLGQIIGEGT
jgi:HTH-type transcriptional regulator/antitoxin HipB